MEKRIASFEKWKEDEKSLNEEERSHLKEEEKEKFVEKFREKKKVVVILMSNGEKLMVYWFALIYKFDLVISKGFYHSQASLLGLFWDVRLSSAHYSLILIAFFSCTDKIRQSKQ